MTANTKLKTFVSATEQFRLLNVNGQYRSAAVEAFFNLADTLTEKQLKDLTFLLTAIRCNNLPS